MKYRKLDGIGDDCEFESDMSLVVDGGGIPSLLNILIVTEGALG